MSRSAPLVLLAALALCYAGCRTPMPPGAATDGFRLGPFFETANDGAGGSMLAVRPFYSSETLSTNAIAVRRERDFLWPLGIRSQRDDHYYWRALLLYGTGTEDDPDSPEDPWRFRLFPLIFSGRTQDGEDYSAFFPFYGTLKNFLFLNDFHFFLFPIYGRGDSYGVKMTTYLWPFYLERHGERLDQFRLWPFYGRSERRGLHITRENRFVAWPFWSETSLHGAVSGDGFILFPIFGHSHYEREKRGDEETWQLLPPFFLYGRGDDGYRKVNAPWPFIRILDMDDHHERHLWPIYGYSKRRNSSREYFLWPLIRRTEAVADGYRSYDLHLPVPFFYRRERELAFSPAPGEDESRHRTTYTRLWPFFSRRDGSGDGKDTVVRVPELTLWSGSSQIERNWAPLWSLYVFRRRVDGAYCNDLLWGALSWGRNASGGRILSLLWIPLAR